MKSDHTDDAPSGAPNQGEWHTVAPHRTRVSVDELVAKSRTVIDRVRPVVEGVVDRVRSRLRR